MTTTEKWDLMWLVVGLAFAALFVTLVKYGWL